MKRYLAKRILFSVFALLVVTGIVMALVYTLLPREQLFANDDTYKKAKGGEKELYRYTKYEEYGYVYFETFPGWLNTQIEDQYSEEYQQAINSVQGTAETESGFPDNEYAVKFAENYKKMGYDVEWVKPIINRKGHVSAEGCLIAHKDKNVFVRLWDYVTNLFKFDTIWSVQDDVGERYLRWEWDPYSNMPALVGNGTKHRYMIYFDDKFPFIHQNFISLQLGKSKDYSGQDTVTLFNTRNGDPIVSEQILPKDIYEENPPKTKVEYDFHSVTYSSFVSSEDAKIYGEGNHYTRAIQNKSGFTRMGTSFVIGIIASVFTYLLGLPLGILMARKKDKIADKIGNAYILFIIAVPSLAYIFMFAAIGMSLFKLPYKWQMAEIPILAYILPIVSLTLPAVAGLMRWIRRYLIDQENADYVKFARSQGLTEREIFSKHIFRNAMVFLVHNIPAEILGCLVGAIITERVYGVPGIGGLLTTAINTHDNGVIIAATVFYTTLTIVSLLLGDLLLAKYDPRVSFTNERG